MQPTRNVEQTDQPTDLTWRDVTWRGLPASLADWGTDIQTSNWQTEKRTHSPTQWLHPLACSTPIKISFGQSIFHCSYNTPFLLGPIIQNSCWEISRWPVTTTKIKKF